MITIERKVHFNQVRRGRKKMSNSEVTPPISAGRVPRVSRLMALAIRLDQLIHDGVATDQAALARLGHVSRARLTQIMNLLNLAPDIQQQILFLPATECGRDAVTERHLRPIAAEVDWGRQQELWGELFLTE